MEIELDLKPELEQGVLREWTQAPPIGEASSLIHEPVPLIGEAISLIEIPINGSFPHAHPLILSLCSIF